MEYVMGIDTGGTYTDSVILNSETGCVMAKAKAFTTHGDLIKGIDNSITSLDFSKNFSAISRVVISTTLATNAIIEVKGQKTGLIVTGKELKERTPAFCTCYVKGKISPKGREICPIDRDEVKNAISIFNENGIKVIAVCGFMSVRNPIHEIEIENIIKEFSNIPVVCSHRISTDLGIFERAVTAALNASLLPIIETFIDSIVFVLHKHGIKAPAYIVKCDGCMAIIDSIYETPIETILSGPVASVIGAMHLTGIGDAIIADMGGTTTDTVLVKNNVVPLSIKGARIGNWQTMVRSIDISTIGLGGDSEIINRDNKFIIGPERVLPACRNTSEIKELHVTPTDLLHATGEFRKWNYQSSMKAISKIAAKGQLDEGKFVCRAIEEIINIIYNQCIFPYQKTGFALVAIGAPAYNWFKKVADTYNLRLITPEHYEIANAIGAAVAKIKETESAIIRPGENQHGFIIYFQSKRVFFHNKSEAIKYARVKLWENVEWKAKKRGAISVNISINAEDVVSDWVDNKGRKKKRFIEMRITAKAIATKL